MADDETNAEMLHARQSAWRAAWDAAGGSPAWEPPRLLPTMESTISALTREQEIRARALTEAIKGLTSFIDPPPLWDMVHDFTAWIENGSVPNG